MKIWEVVRGDGLNAIYRLCGYPIYTVTETENLRERKFCQGFISSKKIWDDAQNIKLKEFYVCAKRISQYGIYKQNSIFKLLGITVYDQNTTSRFYEKYKSKLPPNTDYIFFLNTGLGELSLFLSCCLKTFLQQNHIKNPIFFTETKYHVELLHLFFPNFKIIYVKKIFSPIDGEFMLNHIKSRFIFSHTYFEQIEKKIPNQKLHFFRAMTTYLNLSPKSLLFQTPQIEPTVSKRIEKQLQQIGILKKKFVFISIEAKTCRALPAQFWLDLVKKLQEKGFGIIFNPMHMPLPKGCYMFDLSLQEALVVAKQVKTIIGIRSGLLDLLTTTGTDIYAIYTDFPERALSFPMLSAQNVKIGFDLEQIPPQIRKSHISSFLYSTNLVKDILSNIK